MPEAKTERRPQLVGWARLAAWGLALLPFVLLTVHCCAHQLRHAAGSDLPPLIDVPLGMASGLAAIFFRPSLLVTQLLVPFGDAFIWVFLATAAVQSLAVSVFLLLLCRFALGRHENEPSTALSAGDDEDDPRG